MKQFVEIPQSLTKTNFDGTERGISCLSAKAVRIWLRAPAGQVFSTALGTVYVATRDARTGLLAVGTGALADNSSIIQRSSGVLNLGTPPLSSQSAFFIAEIPVCGDKDDEVVAFVSGTDLSGTASNASEDGKVFVVLERFER